MIKIIIVLIILVLSSSTSTAWSISIPKASIPVDSTSLPGKGEDEGGTDKITASSGGRYEEVSSSPDGSVVINQIMLPIKNDGYLSGQAARIFIEIKNNKRVKNKRDLNGLAVRVINDDELNIMPDSARWIKVYSLEGLCDIKSDIYNCPLDKYPEREGYNKCLINKQSEYILFSYNNSTNINSKELEYIYNRLYKLYDVTWVNKKDVNFYRYNDYIWINNSDNKSFIWIQNRDNAKIDISDGRSYELKINNKDNIKYVNYTNTIIGFDVDALSPKESIIFYYDIKPRKTGIFNTEILVRAYDSDLSHLYDFSHLSKVEVKDSNPEFRINIRSSNSEVYKYDDYILNILGRHPYIDVFYDITYLGGASETYCDNISISFDNSSQECFYIDENGYRNDSLSKRSNFKNYFSFNKYDTQSIHMRVAFSSKGSHILPGIVIEDIRYSFNDQKIDVNTWFFRHLDIIFLFVSTISLIITAAELYAAKRDLKDLARIIKGKRSFPKALNRSPGMIKKLKKLLRKFRSNPEIIVVLFFVILFIILLIIN